MKKNNLDIGDSISVLDENLTGIIIKIVDDTITIETTEGFEFEFSEKELIKVETVRFPAL